MNQFNMKNKHAVSNAFTIMCAVAACGCGKTTRWQYDDIRQRIKEQQIAEQRAAEFNRTNTDHSVSAYSVGFGIEWNPRKGDIELGYRSDGTVVWRNVPEVTTQ